MKKQPWKTRRMKAPPHPCPCDCGESIPARWIMCRWAWRYAVAQGFKGWLKRAGANWKPNPRDLLLIRELQSAIDHCCMVARHSAPKLRAAQDREKSRVAGIEDAPPPGATFTPESP